jgi:hypothetical protein
VFADVISMTVHTGIFIVMMFADFTTVARHTTAASEFVLADGITTTFYAVLFSDVMFTH